MSTRKNQAPKYADVRVSRDNVAVDNKVRFKQIARLPVHEEKTPHLS